MKSPFQNWSDVRIFLMVFREGSTLAASHKLGIAQPTVARRIDVLEKDTGLVLFERHTRGFKPTAVARSLFPLAESLENAASAFAAKANELTEIRPIRITAYSGNFSPRITGIFSEFSVLNPKVSFEFLPGIKALDLAAGEADIALRITRKEPDRDLICRKISTAHYSLYGARSYAEKWGLPISPDNLHGHRFVTFQRDGVPAHLHHWLQRHVSPDQILKSFSEIDLMHAAIKSGHGLGIMNVKMAETDETLIRCFDVIEELSAPHVMLIAPEAYRRPEVKAFVKFFAPRYAAIFK
jgi:DNA-binding transcriptional LysR family regulator